MRIKFVPVIAFLLVFSITIASCLSDNEPGEYPPDATIRAFELDTIYGVNYKFTINQLTDPGEIYNVDSVPHSADTIINKILIKNLVANISSMIIIDDSLYFNRVDSLDFSKTMEKPMKLTVYAPDGVTTKDYNVEVRRHKLDPDSLVWTQMATNIPDNAFSASKTVHFDNQILVYTSNTTLYSSPVGDGRSWSLNNNVQGLPANIELHSLLQHGNKLFIINQDNTLFESIDGITWVESPLGGSVSALLASLPVGLSAIVDGKFAITDGSAWVMDDDKDVPIGFPVKNISTAEYTTSTGFKRTVLVGNTEDGSSSTVPWFTLMDGRMDGKAWASMETTSEYQLPAMENPTVMYYGNQLYAYGDGFETFYTSADGMNWTTVDRKFLFPDAFEGRTDYSVVVDNDNYIWLIWNNDQSGSIRHGNEIWKGRLNRLGFKIQ